MQDWLNDIQHMFTVAFIEGDRWKLYLSGLGVTLQVSLFAAVLGMAIGTAIAFMRLSTRKDGRKTIRYHLAGIYIDIIRGTPVVLQLLIIYFVILSFVRNGVLMPKAIIAINTPFRTKDRMTK
jgi:polar amino acid transport system permease protein/polar amino acid transport system substrate-binding protein